MRSLILGAFLVLAPITAEAATFQIDHYEPIGQSFTATDAYVTVGFNLAVMNPSSGAVNVTATLLAGETTSGTALSSVSLLPASSGFSDFDFSSIELTTGNLYTVLLETTNPYWGVEILFGDPYSGGRAFFDGAGSISDDGTSDLRFRVTPAVVPVPAALPLFGSGVALMGLVGWWRRRKSTNSHA